jgi:hypothetical protein
LLDYEYPMFCSKFLVASDAGWCFIPDPVKFVLKLGRADLANPQHMLEYFTSCKDLLLPYQDARNYHQLSCAVSERYNVPFESSYVFAALAAVSSDFELFKELYIVDKKGNYNKNENSVLLDL